MARVRDADTGVDPRIEAKAASEAITFELLVEEYVRLHLKAKGLRSWRNIESNLNHKSLVHLRKRKAASISKKEIVAVIDRIVADGNPAGQPVKSRAPLSVECDEMILDTANRRIRSPNGSRLGLTLFETQVLDLGTSTGNARTATRRSIEATMDAARRLERRRDEVLRAAVAEAVKKNRR